MEAGEASQYDGPKGRQKSRVSSKVFDEKFLTILVVSVNIVCFRIWMFLSRISKIQTHENLDLMLLRNLAPVPGSLLTLLAGHSEWAGTANYSRIKFIILNAMTWRLTSILLLLFLIILFTYIHCPPPLPLLLLPPHILGERGREKEAE